MSNKAYYALISTLLISTISMFYLYNSNGEEKQQPATEKIAIDESMGMDEEGGIITPAAKKFTLKKEHKKRKVYQTASMKLYKKEDNAAFIARIDKEIEEAQYEAENNYMDPYEIEMNLEEEITSHREEVESIMASHQAMRMAFNKNQEENLDDRFVDDNYPYEEEYNQ